MCANMIDKHEIIDDTCTVLLGGSYRSIGEYRVDSNFSVYSSTCFYPDGISNAEDHVGYNGTLSVGA